LLDEGEATGSASAVVVVFTGATVVVIEVVVVDGTVVVVDTVVDEIVVVGAGTTINAVEVPLPVSPVMSFTVTANTQVDVILEDVAPAV
jgi:hypothetical protein